MRSVPAELADLIPLSAHEGVACVVYELELRFPKREYIYDEPGPSIQTWLNALAIWTAREIVHGAER